MVKMGNHIRIVFHPTLYFILLNWNINFVRLSQLAHSAWRGDGSHFHYIWSRQISCRENVCLVKRDWSSTLHAALISTSLLRLDIGILLVSADESCVLPTSPESPYQKLNILQHQDKYISSDPMHVLLSDCPLWVSPRHPDANTLQGHAPRIAHEQTHSSPSASSARRTDVTVTINWNSESNATIIIRWNLKLGLIENWRTN